MNYPLLSRLLGIVCLLIGGSMIFSLPWAHPALAHRNGLPAIEAFEWRGALALGGSILVALTVGLTLWLLGRKARGQIYRKEAMAVVGLSWVMATVLGAFPYWFSETQISAGRPITFIESMFEAQSGFSTTGATVLTDLETPAMVPHCILFWRSSTHFLGGLGIVVLFVAILGQGSAGKAMMRAEMPGPTKEGSMARMQHTALAFAAIYIGLTLLLTAIFFVEGMSVFDALCHAFATTATGGFSTYNESIGHFDSAWVDYTTILFMVLGGTNFTLLYFLLIGNPWKLLRDVEWQTYIAIIAVVTAGIIFFGMRYADDPFADFASALRYGLFQVVAIITTTGFGTADFDSWNNFGRGVLLVLMFFGGCAGSTGGGMKIIRHVLFFKILRLEIEQAHHPRVVRPLWVGGTATNDPELRRGIPIYFSLILGIFVVSWLVLITFEPDTTWGVTRDAEQRLMLVDPLAADAPPDDPEAQALAAAGMLDAKLLDTASAVAATLNNIGPGLGVVGPKRNYSGFSQGAKLLFIWLMMLGRVEVISIIVLLSPAFWRRF